MTQSYVPSPDSKGSGLTPAGKDIPWLTILVPTYNRSLFLESTLACLIAQIKTFDRQVQLLVSNNRSIDETAAVLQRATKRLPRIEVVAPPVHLPSAEANIAFALPHCRGEYLWIVGDDDYINEGALVNISDLFSHYGFDLFLFNNSISYGSNTATRMIHMAGGMCECSIEELIARTGFTTVAASITSVVMKTDRLKQANLAEFIKLCPYYSHVAGYLAGFKGGRCGFGGEPIATIREAATASVTFGEVIRAKIIGTYEPWGFGIARLIERLIDTDSVSGNFISQVIEQNHESRHYLLQYMLIHCLKQIKVWASSKLPQEAVSDADLAAFRRVCEMVSPEEREVVTRASEIVAVVAGLSAEAGSTSHDRVFGPPLWAMVEEMGQQGTEITTAIHRWVERELNRLDTGLQQRLHLNRERSILATVDNYDIFRQGLDIIAVHTDYLGRVLEICDIDAVNPVESIPWVFIERSVQAVTGRIAQFGEADLSESGSGFLGLGINPLLETGEGPGAAEQSGTGQSGTIAGLDRLRTDNRVLFDKDWYAGQGGCDLAIEGLTFDAALDHFIKYGIEATLSPSVWFDERWYCEKWFGSAGKVRELKFSCGLDHFIQIGARRLLAPSPYVDPAFYLASNGKAKRRMEAGTTLHPLQDYLMFGHKERYSLHPFFDELWYLTNNPEVRAAIAKGRYLSAYHHYLIEGRYKGLDPSPKFSESAYIGNNSDVAEAITGGAISNAFEHWLRYGRDEKRSLGLSLGSQNRSFIIVK